MNTLNNECDEYKIICTLRNPNLQIASYYIPIVCFISIWWHVYLNAILVRSVSKLIDRFLKIKGEHVLLLLIAF